MIRGFSLSFRVVRERVHPLLPSPFSLCLPSPWVDTLLIATTVHTPPQSQVSYLVIQETDLRYTGNSSASSILTLPGSLPKLIDRGDASK
jgi:hypothetical protein